MSFMAVIDANGMVLGRMASAVAQRLLKGEAIEIVNAEKAVITGNKESILERYYRRYHATVKGNPYIQGPKFQRRADRLVAFAVRGMLPYKRATGKLAFKSLRVSIGNPKNAAAERIESAVNRSAKFMTMADVSAAYGVRVAVESKAVGGKV